MFKSTHSLLLAGVSRRSFLKTTAAFGLGAVASPAIVSQALSSSGELSLLNWDDELPDPVIPDFEKATGIKVNSTPFSQNEEQINKLQATDGVGFDLCQPTHDRAPQFKDIGVLQPLDDKRVKLDLVIPGLLKASVANWTWDGKLYHVPHCWGTEAISWRNDLTKIDPADLSFGTLWNDEYKGKVQGRPHSLLLGIGLWMDGTGKLPTNRMLDAYKDEDKMKKIYDVILPRRRSTTRPGSSSSGIPADNTKSGFMTNGVVIGQTWDGPVDQPEEGGQADLLSGARRKARSAGSTASRSVKGAKNIDQAYDLLKYMHSPEGLGARRRRTPATIPRRSAPTSCCRTRRARSSTRPIPASRSTRCGGARSSRRGSPNCAAICREVQGGVTRRMEPQPERGGGAKPAPLFRLEREFWPGGLRRWPGFCDRAARCEGGS